MKTTTKTLLTGLTATAALAAGSANAATIDINGRLITDDTPASGLEWTTGAKDDPISGAPASDSDASVVFTASAAATPTAPDFHDTNSAGGTFQVGEEWNVSTNGHTTNAANAITSDKYLSFTLDSTTLGSDLIDLDGLSVSLWRNGSQAPDTYQFAFDANANGFDTGDLISSATAVGSGIGSATTISLSDSDVETSATSVEVRLYFWRAAGGANAEGNFHVYDAEASYTVIPEPSSLALLGLGGLCMMKRRRRA